MDSQFTDGHVFITSEMVNEINLAVKEKLKLSTITKNYEIVWRELEKFFEGELRVKNAAFYKFFNDPSKEPFELNISLSASTYTRIVRKIGSLKYKVLDFLCLVAWNKSLACCLLCEEFKESENGRQVDIERYGLAEYTTLRTFLLNKGLKISIRDGKNDKDYLESQIEDVQNKKELKEILQPSTDGSLKSDKDEDTKILPESQLSRRDSIKKDERESVTPQKIVSAESVFERNNKVDKKIIHKLKSKNVIILVSIIFVIALISYFWYAEFENKNNYSIDIDSRSQFYEKEISTREFNDNAFGTDCPTVSINNTKKNLITIDKCLGTQIIKVDTQTTIQVVIYCHNSSVETAENVHVKLKVYTDRRLYKTIFSGTIIFNNGDSVAGYAEAHSYKYNTFHFGAIQYFKDKIEPGVNLQNGGEIFSERGLKISDIPGYADCPIIDNNRDCACHEVWLLISFSVK